MTLTELRYIVAVARERHFGKAARACHVSQPTLSVAIKKLEEELGVALVERIPRKVQLTPVGEEIVQRARHVLRDIEQIRMTARRSRDPETGLLSHEVVGAADEHGIAMVFTGMRHFRH